MNSRPKHPARTAQLTGCILLLFAAPTGLACSSSAPGGTPSSDAGAGMDGGGELESGQPSGDASGHDASTDSGAPSDTGASSEGGAADAGFVEAPHPPLTLAPNNGGPI